MTGIGDLRHRVNLHGVAETLGEGGQKTRIYPVIASVWAELKPTSIPVITRAGRSEFVTAYAITCPYAEGYLPARRITLGARTFEVHSIINLNEDRRFLVFQCEEVRT